MLIHFSTKTNKAASSCKGDPEAGIVSPAVPRSSPETKLENLAETRRPYPAHYSGLWCPPALLRPALARPHRAGTAAGWGRPGAVAAPGSPGTWGDGVTTHSGRAKRGICFWREPDAQVPSGGSFGWRLALFAAWPWSFHLFESTRGANHCRALCSRAATNPSDKGRRSPEIADSLHPFGSRLAGNMSHCQTQCVGSVHVSPAPSAWPPCFLPPDNSIPPGRFQWPAPPRSKANYAAGTGHPSSQHKSLIVVAGLSPGSFYFYFIRANCGAIHGRPDSHFAPSRLQARSPKSSRSTPLPTRDHRDAKPRSVIQGLPGQNSCRESAAILDRVARCGGFAPRERNHTTHPITAGPPRGRRTPA